jgi:branched-chain amino acid aminotransferase
VLEGKRIWIDGKLIDYNKANVHILTHGLHYGTGVFEGIRCYITENGPAVFRLDDHVKRLINSGKAYFMNFEYSSDQIKQAIADTIKSNDLDDCYIRIIAFYGHGKLGVNPLPNRISVAISVLKWSEHIKKEDKEEEGIHAMTSSWMKVDVRSMPSHAKGVANYANSALARMDALKSGFDEAIMLNSNGYVVEASAENIFFVRDGVVSTPHLSTGALEGITRDTVIEILKQDDIPFRIDNATRDELYFSDEIFLTGTASEIVPVGKVDHRIIGHGKIGPITKKIRDHYELIVRGKDAKIPALWLTYLK